MINIFYVGRFVKKERMLFSFALLLSLFLGNTHTVSAAIFYEPAISVPAQYDNDTGQLVRSAYTYIRTGFTTNLNKTKFYPNESMTVTAGGDTMIRQENPSVSVDVRPTVGGSYVNILPRSFITGYATRNLSAPAVPGNYTLNAQGTTHSVQYGYGSLNFSYTVYPYPPAIPIISLSANQSSVANGQPVTLTWGTSGATNCAFTGDYTGSTSLAGTFTTPPLTKTGVNTFTLRCGNSSWYTSKGVTVTVAAPVIPPPEVVPPPSTPAPVVTNSNVTVDSGSSVTLSWNVTNATGGCTASQDWSGYWSDTKPILITRNTGPLTTNKNYVLTCTGDGGAVAEHWTSVGVRGPAVISVTPASLDFGSIAVASSTFRSFTVSNTGPSTLTGSVSVSAPYSCVSGCTYSITSLPITTTLRFDPSSAGSFPRTATFTGGGGATRPVTGSAFPLAPTVSLSASASPIPYDSATTLNWTSSGATTCTASGDWSGGKALSGSESTGNVKTSKTYTLTCAGSGGSTASTATVSINAPVCGNSVCEKPGETVRSCSKDCPLIIEEF